MQTRALDSTGWTLNILAYGESSPLENHHPFELGADNENRQIWAHELLLVTMGTDSIETACIEYANLQSATE